MEKDITRISYDSTGFFSTIVTDYIDANPLLQPFYNYPVSKEGIEKSIETRRTKGVDREGLVEVLRQQYARLEMSQLQSDNLTKLLLINTYTITTAHQPNIFTGPLYFIYKILHAIKLANSLNKEYPQYHFVPIYYMGSEDADLEELGFINLGGEKLIWQTNQTGAVGRMRIDKAFLQLIETIYGQIGVHPHGNELASIFRKVYTEGSTIQEATLFLVNELFAHFGLLVIIPDNPILKQAFNEIVKKELTEQFSQKAVYKSNYELSKRYKVQAHSRYINLFYLIDDKRERIELLNNIYHVNHLDIEFDLPQILNELENYPERFSANVILRGVFQETVLPNIAFIGGGGELAYWLELKEVFKEANVPFPMLILRNSFLLIHPNNFQNIEKLGLTITEIFEDLNSLIKKLVLFESSVQLYLTKEKNEMIKLYQQIADRVDTIDQTLKHHVQALQKKSMHPLNELEKKMFRAEKRKHETIIRQITKLKNELFPNNNLQERIENFSIYYARFGKKWLQEIYDTSLTIEQQFIVKLINT